MQTLKKLLDLTSRRPTRAMHHGILQDLSPVQVAQGLRNPPTEKTFHQQSARIVMNGTYLNYQFVLNAERRMLEGFDDRHVGVLEIGILANQDNLDFVEVPISAIGIDAHVMR